MTRKLPFQALPPFSFSLSTWKDCSRWFCSAGVCFCGPAKIHVRCCKEVWLVISACVVVGNLPSGACCDPGRCVFVEFHQNGILVLFLLLEVAFADVFHLPKNVVFCVQNSMQPWRPCEIVEIVLQGLSGMREQGNTRMRIKMRKTVGADCAQCAPSLRLVCA